MNNQDYQSLDSAHDMFLSYLYQYLVLSGCHQSAHTLVKEARVQLKNDVSGAYLYDFWCLLWNLHSSSRLSNPMPPPPLPGSRMYSIAESRVANGPEHAQFRAPPGMRPGFVQQKQGMQMQQMQMQQQLQNQQQIPGQQLQNQQQQQQQQLQNQQHLQQQHAHEAQPIMVPGHPPLVVRKGYPQLPSVAQKLSISPSYGHQDLPSLQTPVGGIPQENQYMPVSNRALFGQAQFKPGADGNIDPSMGNMAVNNGINGNMNGNINGNGNGSVNGNINGNINGNMVADSGANGVPVNTMNGAPMNGAPMNGLILDMAMAMGTDLGMGNINNNNHNNNNHNTNGGNVGVNMNAQMAANGQNNMGNMNNMGMGNMPGNMGGNGGIVGSEQDNGDILFGTPLAMSF